MRTSSIRFLLYFTAALIYWGIIQYPLPAAGAGEVPHIVFKEDSHNFGDVYKGERVRYAFVFENGGSGDLLIENVRTSCGCTAAAPTGRTIPPGAAAEIEVAFKTDVFIGNVRKTITVDTNDPETPHYVLTIEANVLEEVVAEPRRLWFDQIQQGRSSSVEVVIRPLTDLKLKVEKVRSSSPILKLRARKKEGENAYLLTVSTRKNAPLGRFAGDIQVFTNCRRQSILTIPFFGEVISDVSVFPTKISYGVVEKGREAMRQVLITVHKKGVELKGFEVEPDYLKLHLMPDEADFFHRLEITLSKNVPEGRLEGRLQIHTTSKDQPLLTIPIYGVIRGG